MNKKIVSLVVLASLFGLALFVSATELTPPPGVPTNVTTLVTNIATGVGGIIGSLGALMIVVAGLLFMTSAGNPQRLETAKKALFYAIIGIVIGVSAGAIVVLVSGWMAG